jgi:hypothetical protein
MRFVIVTSPTFLKVTVEVKKRSSFPKYVVIVACTSFRVTTSILDWESSEEVILNVVGTGITFGLPIRPE